MASVYVLCSSKADRFYTGSCREISFRLTQHREKVFKRSYTAMADDWELYLEIPDLSYDRARLIEAYIKRMKSRRFIIGIKKDP